MHSSHRAKRHIKSMAWPAGSEFELGFVLDLRLCSEERKKNSLLRIEVPSNFLSIWVPNQGWTVNT